MELKVQQNEIKAIGFNYEELKSEIINKAELYKNMVYTEETIKEAKSDRATLNNFIKVLEDEKKRVKKECLKPYEDFEKKIKDLVAIINEPVLLIDAQVKNYEEKEKAEKLEKIKEIWENAENKPDWLMCNDIFNKKWLNKSTSLKKVTEEINAKIEEVNNDIKTITALKEYSFEAMDFYKRTLDLNGAIAEGQRLVELQKAKEERAKAIEEAKAKAIEEEKQKEQEQKAQEVSVETEKQEIKKATKSWVKFEAFLDTEQAKNLAVFCKENDIEIRAI